MPLNKNMSHEEMVKELISSYKKTGKIGATEPKDMKHALEIANAVAYNIGESEEVKAIERNVKEMTLDEILESMEKIISAKEKELGLSEAYGQENPKVKVTLDSGETFETEVDPATSEDDLEKQYKTGTEINVGKEGQEKKARIKSATLTKQMGEDFDQQSYDMYVEDPDLYDLEMLQDMKQGFMDKRGSWTDEDIAELNAITKRMKELKATNEDLENPPAVIENPTDVVSLDIPLLMRLLEWSREQAGEDVDLHVLTENLVEAMKDTEFLTMDDYERLVPCEECDGEEEPMGESFSEDRADIEQTYGVDLSKNLKFNGLDEVPNEWLEFIEDSNYTFNNVQDLFKQQGYIIERVNEPTIETNYITFKVFKDQMGAKPTGVMEVTRVDLLKNNAYDIAYKIQRELEDRYPSILECDGSCATTSSDMGADPILPFGKKNKVKQLKNKKSNRTVK